jgi:hypothetical protein
VSGKHAVNDRSSMILEIVDFTTAVQMSLRESNALFPYSRRSVKFGTATVVPALSSRAVLRGLGGVMAMARVCLRFLLVILHEHCKYPCIFLNNHIGEF